MKSHLITIVNKINVSIKKSDSEIAYQTNLELLEVEPMERYFVIKGFKLADIEKFYSWAQLLYKSEHSDAKECMTVLLDEIYLISEDDEISEQFNRDAYAGNNLGFVVDEIKLILGN